MDLKKFMKSLSNDELQVLSNQDTAEALQQAAREAGYDLNMDDVAALFAALYPWRSGMPVNEETLEQIAGGRPTMTFIKARPSELL